MQPYGIHIDYEPLGVAGRCDTRACPYPGVAILLWDHWTGVVGKKFVCWMHFLTGSSPMSMEYEDADTLLAVPKGEYRRSRGVGGSRGNKMVARRHWETQKWDHARILALKSNGFSYGSALAKIATEAKDEGRLTHYIDPVFNVFTELRRSMVYSMCGEKIIQSLTIGFDLKPTCDTCLRMHQIKVAALPAVPLREVIRTAPKMIDDTPTFEDMIIDGTMGLDDAAFANRRNWGERSGRVWNDPSQGVQRVKGLRWDRGGVNRKRG